MRIRFVPRQLFAAVMGGVLLGGCVAGEPLVRSYGAKQQPTYVSDRNITRLMYALPTAKVLVTIEGNADGVVTMAAPTINYYPDTENFYVLEYAHNEFADDTFTFERDPKTLLLKTIATVSKDKTADLVPLVTATLTEFKKAKDALASNASKIAGIDKEKKDEEKYTPFKFTLEVDPDREVSCSEKPGAHLDCLHNRLASTLAALNKENEEKKWKLAFKMDMLALPHTSETVDTLQCATKVCFRTPHPFKLILTSNLSDRTDVTETVLMLPNQGLIGSIDFTRHAFVENKVTAEFDNGMLKKLIVEDPSEVAGFLKLPSSILQLVVAGATL